jgi:hypothetical protein
MIFRTFLPVRGFKDRPGDRHLAFCAEFGSFDISPEIPKWVRAEAWMTDDTPW